jgi:hypothetical protein
MTVAKMILAMQRGDLLIESPFARLLGKRAYITVADMQYLVKSGHFDLSDVIDLDYRTC